MPSYMRQRIARHFDCCHLCSGLVYWQTSCEVLALADNDLLNSKCSGAEEKWPYDYTTSNEYPTKRQALVRPTV